MAYDPAAQPITLATVTTSKLVNGGQARLMGWCLIETTGSAAASLDMYDGGDSSGQLIGPISLTASQSTRDWLSGEGIRLRRGLFVNVLSGSVRGVFWLRLPMGMDVEPDPR